MPRHKPKSRKRNPAPTDDRIIKRKLKEAIAKLSWLRSLTLYEVLEAGMTIEQWNEAIRKAKQVILEYESPSIQALRGKK